MADQIEYWLDLADYDLGVAKTMLKNKHWLYVGFMCHQVIEKALKAVISRDESLPPKIHDLAKLAVCSGLMDVMSEAQQDFIETLNPLNIEARYPKYKDSLAQNLGSAVCRQILKETEGLLCWIKEQLYPEPSNTPSG